MWDWLAHPYCYEATLAIRNGDILASMTACAAVGFGFGFLTGTLKWL